VGSVSPSAGYVATCKGFQAILNNHEVHHRVLNDTERSDRPQGAGKPDREVFHRGLRITICRLHGDLIKVTGNSKYLMIWQWVDKRVTGQSEYHHCKCLPPCTGWLTPAAVSHLSLLPPSYILRTASGRTDGDDVYGVTAGPSTTLIWVVASNCAGTRR